MRNLFRFRTYITSVLLLALGIIHASTIIDSKSHTVPSMASVFDKNGKLVGMTDNNGNTPQLSISNYPLTVRYIGFAPITIQKPTDEVLTLDEIKYELPELTVGGETRKILHLVGYMREYSTQTTSKDTVALYADLIVDFMTPMSKRNSSSNNESSKKKESWEKFKGWLNPRILGEMRYYHFTNDVGLDSVSSKSDSMLPFSNFISIFNRMSVPTSFQKEGVTTDTVKGERYISSTWRKIGNNIVADFDALSSCKDHKYTPNALKLFELTTDFTKLNYSYLFSDVVKGYVFTEDISRMSCNMEMTGRGKLFKLALKAKEPLKMNYYCELFVTEKEYLTEEEAKDLKKNPPKVSAAYIKVPEGIEPISPAIPKLIERVQKAP